MRCGIIDMDTTYSTKICDDIAHLKKRILDTRHIPKIEDTLNRVEQIMTDLYTGDNTTGAEIRIRIEPNSIQITAETTKTYIKIG